MPLPTAAQTAGASAAPGYAALRGRSMGTTWTVRLPALPDEAQARRIGARIQAALDLIVDQMSTWDETSDLCRLNRAPCGWYQVPEAFFQVLRCALEVADRSQGAYDPTVGRLVDLWGFGPCGPVDRPPEPARISAALQTAGWRRTALNAPLRGVWQPGGLCFDLSSIAKGYGVDAMARVLDEHGVRHYLAELGGELKLRGQGPRGGSWRLDIESPEPGGHGLPLCLTDTAIATSGDYRRRFEHGGQRYAHTLDPRSGRPLAHNLASVSVVHGTCMMADALATALLCMGPGQGPDYARRHGIAALFMTRHPEGIAVDWTPAFLDIAQPPGV